MKNLLIIGAGTAGTIVANRMSRDLRGWAVTVVDPGADHAYQAGLLHVPFDMLDEASITRPRTSTLGPHVRWVREAVRAIDTSGRTVETREGGKYDYDIIVIASGCRIRPDLTEGLTGEGWGTTAFDFYTQAGSSALKRALAAFEGGRLVVNVVEMPIKCPVAPLEFLFLADAYFTERKMRDRVELVYATPLDAAFTKPIAARTLGHLLDQKGISVETEFSTAEVDGGARVVRSFDDREVAYDLLVSIPTHSGADFIETSGLGNELAFVPADKNTLAVDGHENVFVLGDAGDFPTSKAGSVAHFQADALESNLVRATRGLGPLPTFDGHANCFVETGHGKALLIDFNYETEPLTGDYPVPGVGPFSLLEESRANHAGKMAFRWLYWNALLRGRPLPVPAHMSLAGKHLPTTPT